MSQCRKDEGLRSEERLRRKKDFQIIAKVGIRRYTKNFVIIMRRNDLEFSRVGAVAGKKMGKAVERNRVKRLIREFFRKNKDKLPLSADYIIVGKKGAQELKYAQVVEELRPLLELGLEDRRKSGEVSP
jgi:ribonuclease P protein component